MIVLVQMQTEAGWVDMQTPRQKDGMPVKGMRPSVKTPADFGELLKLSGLVGEYRAFLDDGTLWRVVVERRDEFVVRTTQEIRTESNL